MKSISRVFFLSFLFSTFFCFHYFDVFYIGSIKFAQIWKPILVIIAFIIVLFHFRRMPSFVWWGYLFSIKSLISSGVITYPVESVSFFFKFIVLPLAYNYLSVLFPLNGALYKTVFKVENMIYLLSVFIVLSVLPFILGIVDPVSSGYELGIYGVEITGFSGVFQNSHSAAIILSSATVFLIFKVSNLSKGRGRFFLYGLIILGGYAILDTYVRTGWIMFVIGLAVYFFSKNNIKNYLKLLPYVVVFLFIVIAIYENSEIVQLRVNDTNVYTENLEWYERVGSGRLVFAYTNITNWLDSDIDTILFGFGQGVSMDKMEDVIGVRLFSHNAFVDALSHNGLIGILIFIIFILSMFSFIRKNKESQYYSITLSVYCMYVIFLLVQGGNVVLLNFFIAALLLLISRDFACLVVNVKKESVIK